MKRIMLLLLMLFPVMLHAEDRGISDYSDFANIPMLHEGRIKPLDSFARVMFKHISGKQAPAQGSPAEWLAHVLFAPQEAVNDRIFLVRSPELPHMLSLPEYKDRNYSFAELATPLASQQATLTELATKDKKSLLQQEQDLVGLYATVNDYADLMGTFSLLMPLGGIDNETRHMLGKPDDAPVTYLDLLKIKKDIDTKATDTYRRKADHIDTYSADEMRVAKLGAKLSFMQQVNGGSALLRVIPPSWEDSEEWLSPWAVMAKSAGSPQNAKLFADWQVLATAHMQGDAVVWQKQSLLLMMKGLGQSGVRAWALTLEMLYNDFNLLNKALLIYVLGFALAVTGMLRRSGRWLTASYGVLLFGATLHGAAIATRMAILLRPPVSTLYESMIFVSFIAIVFGLWLERVKKGADGLLISSSLACLLLISANVFAGGDDTLEVLVAVLNTNFWLGTHVVCITTGYGSSLVAGTLAHLYLIKRAAGRAEERELASLSRRIHSVAVVALFFTAVGTMLGGIWADQSWGRFWGWDPKENGALWIVLWLIWLLHGRIAGQLGPLGFAVGMAFINVVVALAWVGVNLLNVGLHSYGFTDTAANSLCVFCALEFAYVGITKILIMRRERLVL
jgi:ABC-type transport system involved in cytochrome c biogenesis permease subunit